MVSLGSRGQTSNLADWQPSISPNGRFVAWCSISTNLAKPDRHRGPWLGPGWDRRMGCARTLAVSGDERGALFGADAPGVVPADDRDPCQSDIFVAEPLR